MMKKIMISMLSLALMGGVVCAEGDEVKKLAAIEKTAKHPKGVNLKLMSEDADYGYSDKKPIRVGSKEEFGGPQAEREYFATLLDAAGKPVKVQRLFSGGNDPEGHVLDCYEVETSTGVKVKLWISMYHPKNKPEKQPAPVGFYKKRG
ncbi:hypothetical protein Rhal01_02106 [Rubritalea halochordaticola]|uniref:Uncharacterized protein n=1 Tax=Rubritalea halochordaticola TaxID=714537 RepID=A0ABP9V1R0_9BACT